MRFIKIPQVKGEVFRALGIRATPEEDPSDTCGIGRKGLPSTFLGTDCMGTECPLRSWELQFYKWEGMILNLAPKEFKRRPKWWWRGGDSIEMKDGKKKSSSTGVTLSL